jgi:hypothetical protein
MPKHFVMSIAFLLSASSGAQQPDFDPSKLKGPANGPANEVLVLGSAHLSQVSRAFDPAALRPLLDRLAAWRPQAIAIEAVSGPQCDFMRRYPQRYQDSIASYCPEPAPARAATGLDVPAATAEADKLLAGWPAAPSAAQRRRLAAVFLAGGDRASAVVQWLRLAQAERRSGDGLDGALVDLLNKLQARRDESILIAAHLAARLGHERVYPMDDHTADSPSADEKAAGAAISKAWDNPATKQRLAAGAAQEALLGTAEGVLAMYRADNAPGQGKLVFDSDFGAAMEEPSPQRFGRNYLAYWETRNLRMAANIREAMGERPGMRMLVIVGASHKGYLEAYLHQMHDLRVLDTGAVLR